MNILMNIQKNVLQIGKRSAVKEGWFRIFDVCWECQAYGGARRFLKRFKRIRDALRNKQNISRQRFDGFIFEFMYSASAFAENQNVPFAVLYNSFHTTFFAWKNQVNIFDILKHINQLRQLYNSNITYISGKINTSKYCIIFSICTLFSIYI